MGRCADPKCVYCARNYRTEDEARAKHPDCYVGHNCRVKRYRLLNKSKVNAKRCESAARSKGVSSINSILPDAFRAELILYGKEGQFVHAIALKIYKGNVLTHEMAPQHTQGLRQPELEDYVKKLLAHIQVEFGINCFGLIYWLDVERCSSCNLQR